MDNNILSKKYNEFLKLVKQKIETKDFNIMLDKAHNIDSKYYDKKISIDEMKKYIEMYEKEDIVDNKAKSAQIIFSGNPEITAKLIFEAVRNNINIILIIEDFCVAQNMLLVSIAEEILKDIKLNLKIELKNQISDKDIIKIANLVDYNICIGNSNDYNKLNSKINNLKLYPYNIFEVYCDTDEFDELKNYIFDYCDLNQFEIDFYDDLKFEEAIKAINRDGYKFCSLLLSKDNEKIKKFKEEINSKYVIINENPFKITEFELEIK